jgi:hypothetical protein
MLGAALRLVNLFSIYKKLRALRAAHQSSLKKHDGSGRIRTLRADVSVPRLMKQTARSWPARRSKARTGAASMALPLVSAL